MNKKTKKPELHKQLADKVVEELADSRNLPSPWAEDIVRDAIEKFFKDHNL